MISKTLIIGLCALVLTASAAKLPHLLGTCDICAGHDECASGSCWGYPSRCVTSHDYSHLVKCGYKHECGSCFSDVQCATGKCWSADYKNKKCVYDTEASKAKCFKPHIVLKKNCDKCAADKECKSGKCWAGKCVASDKPADLLICGFLPECYECHNSNQCSTKKCWGPGHGIKPKCTFDTIESQHKCFPKPLKKDCEKCAADKECKSGKCWAGKCVKSDKPYDLLVCGFLPECYECHNSSQCSTKKCWGPGHGIKPKCTFDTIESQHKCFPKPLKKDCEKCAADKECKSGKCWAGKCVKSDKPYDLEICGFLPECYECHNSNQCSTKKCWGPGHGIKPKCTFDTIESKHKCFPPLKKDCEKCAADKECKSGKCWAGKCVASDKPYDLQICGFLPECYECHNSNQCSTKKCWGPGHGIKPKCTFDTAASKHKCFPPKKNPVCGTCSKNSDCISDHCYGGKCVFQFNYLELIKCGFKPECKKCSSNTECATKKCWGPHGKNLKCTFETKASQHKCFYY